MNAFQILLVTLLVMITIFTVHAAAHGQIRKRIAAFWLFVWSAAGTAIVWPQSTVIVAQALGIGRGADLILYCSVLAMLVGFFYTYTRFRRLDRQITLLVRRLAIEGARAASPQAPDRYEPPDSAAPGSKLSAS